MPPPGPASASLARRLAGSESRNVTYRSERFPIFWERAAGSNVWDADGNRYVDLTAAFGVAIAGHAHPRIVEAIRRQSARLAHGMGDVHPPAVKVDLLERLAALAPVPDPRVLLATSGAEAVEAALKTACLASGRPGVLAFTGAYHGLTYGALAVTDRTHFREPFERQLNPHVVRAGYPHPYRPPERLLRRPPGCAAPTPPARTDAVSTPPARTDAVPTPVERTGEALADAALADVEALLDGESGGGIGAVVVEPLQGRGGDVVPPPGFLRRLADACRERGVLLVLDEVYTGFGRTGRTFACEEEGVVPDLLCVGKGLSGSMPISACIGAGEVMRAWPESTGEAIHTSTFLGHPVGCAAAVACLDVQAEEGLAARAAEVGARWLVALEEMAGRHAAVGDVRGRGLMIGLDLVRDRATREPDPALAGRVVLAALRAGWILLAGGPAGNVIGLSPPLNIEEGLLEAATGMLDAALESAAEDAA